MTDAVDRERQLRLKRVTRWRAWFGCAAAVLVVAGALWWTLSTDALQGPGWLVIFGAIVLLLAPVVGVFTLRTWLFARYVSSQRPEDAVLALAVVAESIVPLREIVPALQAGTTMIAAVGPDAIRIWTSRTPTPQVSIAYRSIRRIWIDTLAPELTFNSYGRSRLRSVVVVGFEGDDRVLREVPFMPWSGKIERFVDALNERTALPWLDAPPETTTAPEA